MTEPTIIIYQVSGFQTIHGFPFPVCSAFARNLIEAQEVEKVIEAQGFVAQSIQMSVKSDFQGYFFAPGLEKRQKILENHLN